MANENPFLSAGQSLIIKPKTIAKQAFKYSGVSDLENLIKFVGSEPKVKMEQGKLHFTFGKKEVPDSSIVLRDAFGKVTDVLTMDEANELYEVAASREFDPKDANKVETPVKKDKKDKGKK